MAGTCAATSATSSTPSPTSTGTTASPASTSTTRTSTTPALIGAGVGYKFNRWLRADVTVDYEWPADFDGTSPCPAPCAGGGTTVNRESAEFSAITALANVYVDLGNYHGFTPYVGAGVGAAYVMIDDIVSQSGDGYRRSSATRDDWNFAWALMAGSPTTSRRNLALDLGYRYLNLGDVEQRYTGRTRGWRRRSFNYDDLQAHEIRVGMRYTFF